jgi:hypothetical protein
VIGAFFDKTIGLFFGAQLFDKPIRNGLFDVRLSGFIEDLDGGMASESLIIGGPMLFDGVSLYRQHVMQVRICTILVIEFYS